MVTAKPTSTSSEQALCLSCTIARTREVQFTVECGSRRHAHISRQTWHDLEKSNDIIQAHDMLTQHILDAVGYGRF